MLPGLCSLASVWDSDKNLLLPDTGMVLHKLYRVEGNPQKFSSCVLASLIWKAIICFL